MNFLVDWSLLLEVSDIIRVKGLANDTDLRKSYVIYKRNHNSGLL